METAIIIKNRKGKKKKLNIGRSHCEINSISIINVFV